MLAAKRTAPSDGLAAALLDAQRRGEISEGEMLATVTLLYCLGHMDAGYIVAAGLNLLAELPDVYDEFRNNPSARDAIINEIIRYDPAELSVYRTNTEDLVIGSVNIPAGSSIRYLIGAANRDPDVYNSPQMFDHHRPAEQSRNMSFGLGVHGCIGQAFSRAQARTIFEVVAERFSKIALVEPVVMANNDFSRHFKKLSLRLTR